MTEKPTPNDKTEQLEKSAKDLLAERKKARDKAQTDKPENVTAEARQKPAGRLSWSLRFLIILIIFLVGAGTSLYFLPDLKARIPVLARWIGEDAPAQQEKASLSLKISEIEARLTHQDENIQALNREKDNINQRLEELTARNFSENNIPEINPQIMTRLEKLELAQIESGKIEGGKAQISKSVEARIDMLLNRMNQLEASFIPLSKGLVDAQEARQERAHLTESLSSQMQQLKFMESRLNKVENYAARDNSGALLAFRIGELRRKVLSGQAFGPEIMALNTMAEQGSFAFNSALNDSLSWLNQHKAGIVPREKLRDQFNDLIPTLIRSQSTDPDAAWWLQAYNRIKNLIMIRKTKDTTGENLDDVIAKTQQILNRLDLNEALILLKQLPLNIRESIAAWIMQAEISLRAEDELNRIESLVAAYYLAPEKNMPQLPQTGEGTAQ